MLKVRCKSCNKEIISSTKTQCCGCPNMLTVREDNITAVDLNQVVVVNSTKEPKKKGVLSSHDLAFQEEEDNEKYANWTLMYGNVPSNGSNQTRTSRHQR